MKENFNFIMLKYGGDSRRNDRQNFIRTFSKIMKNEVQRYSKELSIFENNLLK